MLLLDDTRVPSQAEYRAALDRLGTGGAREIVLEEESSGRGVRGPTETNDLGAVLWALGGALLIALAAAWLGRGTRRAAPSARQPSNGDRRTPRSTELAGEGRFADALGARYEELIVALEQRGHLRRHLAATGRSYQHQLPEDAAVRFAALLAGFYPARYGGALIDAGAYQRWSRSAAELEASS